jgi:hypothetical protein
MGSPIFAVESNAAALYPQEWAVELYSAIPKSPRLNQQISQVKRLPAQRV